LAAEHPLPARHKRRDEEGAPDSPEQETTRI
jgi:hypothetical protein